jgi:FkbM family methyltransferase
MPLQLHRKLARSLGYDLQKFNKQMQLETHLRLLLPLLEIDVVLDVGANEGQYARMLREELDYAGTIHSFEPIPDAYATLKDAASSDDHWFVHNFALGDAESELEINVSNHSVFSSFHDVNTRGNVKFREGIGVAESISVPVRRLDAVIQELIPDYRSRRLYLKMDTQGHDKWVFEGAGEMIGELRGLQSELSVLGIYDGVPDYVEMFQLYRSHGFELSGIYAVNRYRGTGHIIELDCVFAALPPEMPATR